MNYEPLEVTFTAKEWKTIDRDARAVRPGGALIVLRQVQQLTRRPELKAKLSASTIKQIEGYARNWRGIGTYQIRLRTILEAVARARGAR